MYSILGNGGIWLNHMYSMPMQYQSLFLCTYPYSAVTGFQHLSRLISQVYFNTLKGTCTDIVYWFQYIDTLYRAEYCTTSNEFDINGVDLSDILHITNIEMAIASNAYSCTCKYLCI